MTRSADSQSDKPEFQKLAYSMKETVQVLGVSYITAPPFIARARAYAAATPGAISGHDGHNQTFSLACALVNGFALNEGEALALLREWNAACQPPWGEHELVHKVRSATAARHHKPRGHLLGGSSRHWTAPTVSARVKPRATPVPIIDPATTADNYLGGFRCDEADLWEASPVRLESDWLADAALLAQHLYHPGERINFVTTYVGKDGKARPSGVGETVERDAFIALCSKGAPSSKAGGWLRMNPVDGQGVTDANVTAYRFALLESDCVPIELQLSLWTRLPLPVACIMSSGGKSFHCWVRVDATSADEYRASVSRMLALLHRFGADGKNKNPSRLSRLPGAQRIIGAKGDGRQRLLYLNPNPKQRAIL